MDVFVTHYKGIVKFKQKDLGRFTRYCQAEGLVYFRYFNQKCAPFKRGCTCWLFKMVVFILETVVIIHIFCFHIQKILVSTRQSDLHTSNEIVVHVHVEIFVLIELYYKLNQIGSHHLALYLVENILKQFSSFFITLLFFKRLQ